LPVGCLLATISHVHQAMRRSRGIAAAPRLARPSGHPQPAPTGVPPERQSHCREAAPPQHHAEEDRRFLGRCQIDTPSEVVALAWQIAHRHRARFGLVGDFGCGDGRFARLGSFDRYIGFEVDTSRTAATVGWPRTSIELGCAFEKATGYRFDLCIGNPPYVRHHDVDLQWRRKIERVLAGLLPYAGDGRANAYVYFIWLALALTANDGLVVLVLPHDWVCRPASSRLREYIRRERWAVDVYLLRDVTFGRVLTTSSLCVIDKAQPTAAWRYFDLAPGADPKAIRQPTRSSRPALPYERAAKYARAQRGLSPGNQHALLLNEGERIRFGLEPGRDVVPAVSSFRHLEAHQSTLSTRLFRDQFVNRGRRCWLISQPATPSPALAGFLERVPAKLRSTETCRGRDVWWRFRMPEIPQLLYASGFVTERPKAYLNDVGAIHVGGVHGIFCASAARARAILAALRTRKFAPRVVALSKGFMKVEVHQMNAFLNELADGAE
jgi:hypothetical protein